jgi:hypothetical protein
MLDAINPAFGYTLPRFVTGFFQNTALFESSTQAYRGFDSRAGVSVALVLLEIRIFRDMLDLLFEKKSRALATVWAEWKASAFTDPDVFDGTIHMLGTVNP